VAAGAGSGRSTPSESGQEAVLAAIAALREDLNFKWDQCMTEIRKTATDIGNISADLTIIKSDLNSVKAQADENSEDVEQLKSENRDLREKLKHLKSEISDLQQHTRKNNIIISGVPATKGENLHAVLVDLARVLHIDFQSSDVSAAHRLPSKIKNKPSSIVVCFVSRGTKAIWMAARRKKKSLSSAELSGGFPDQVIYFNDHLTPQSMEILSAARMLVKKEKLAFAWTDEGRILIKKTVTDYPRRIRNLEELEEYSKALYSTTVITKPPPSSETVANVPRTTLTTTSNTATTSAPPK